MIPYASRTVAALALLAASFLSAATRKPTTGWSKPGVSLQTYRADALTCGKEGYYLDIEGTDDAEAFVRGSRALDAATQDGGNVAPGADPIDAAVVKANEFERIRRTVQPERRMAHIKALQQATVDRCLERLGYVRFELSGEQRHALGKLAIGSEGRRAYLYKLASDPAINRTPIDHR